MKNNFVIYVCFIGFTILIQFSGIVYAKDYNDENYLIDCVEWRQIDKDAVNTKNWEKLD